MRRWQSKFALHFDPLGLDSDLQRDVEVLYLARGDGEVRRVEVREALGEDIDLVLAGRQALDLVVAVLVHFAVTGFLLAFIWRRMDQKEKPDPVAETRFDDARSAMSR